MRYLVTRGAGYIGSRLVLLALALSLAVVASPAAAQAPATQPSWRVGDPVQVSWTGSWYPAKIRAVRDGRYLIRYDGYDASWDEWVTPARMRRAEPPKPPVTAAQSGASASSSTPAGRYVCQTFDAGQLNNVGEFVLAANGSYQDVWNKGRGRYTYDAKTRRIRFTSGPQRNDRATVTFDPTAGRGRRGWIQFTYPGGAKLHCYR